jgi:hypothetical protein
MNSVINNGNTNLIIDKTLHFQTIVNRTLFKVIIQKKTPFMQNFSCLTETIT